MVPFDLVVVVERHAYGFAVAGVVALVAAEVPVVSVAFVWQTDDLGWMSHLHHRTIQNWCRMEMVMGTVAIGLLALGWLFGTLESIRLRPIAAIVTISPVDVGRTGNKRKIISWAKDKSTFVWNENFQSFEFVLLHLNSTQTFASFDEKDVFCVSE